MKKHIKLFLTFFILVISDGFLTAYNTPDLKKEANPLVMHMGFGWPALVISNIIVLAIYYLCAKTAFNYHTMCAGENLTFRQYIALLFYGDKDKFKWCFTRPLKIWKPFWAMFGYSFCYTMLAARSIAVIEWIFITAGIIWSPYWRFRMLVPFERIDIWIAIPIALMLFAVWMVREYKYSNATAAVK